MKTLQSTILVRGGNDVASAVAHRLFQSGYPVAIHEGPAPTTARRRMAFTDAVFDSHAWLEGVRAVQPVARGGHDTRIWVKMAADGSRFGSAGKPFEDAAALWKEGLLNDE